MQISPQEFAQLLQKTSLSIKDREAIVRLITKLNDQQFEELIAVLKENAKETKKIKLNAHSEINQEVVKFNLELENLNDK